jgi:transcriptional regulator with XRE-family HTH domain
MRLIDLAEVAGISKGYLSSLEHGDSSRPSGEKLYAIAQALGVNMSDLLGRRLIVASEQEVPPSLREFAEEHGLPEADVQMLAGIQFRGGQPRSKERWAHIYSAIRTTQWMDEGPGQ